MRRLIRIIRNFLLLVIAAIVVLAGILLFNVFSHRSRQIEVAAAPRARRSTRARQHGSPRQSASRPFRIFSIPSTGGRPGTGEEIAAAIDYLLSEAAGFTSGITLPVDGAYL